jgi:toxin CcdB
MAQFDVHRNPGANSDSIPFIVVVQSSIFDGYQRRVVVPLVRKAHLEKIGYERFNPTFTIRSTAVVLHPLEIVSIPVDKLGARVGSLADHGDRIIGALDELLSRVHY